LAFTAGERYGSMRGRLRMPNGARVFGAVERTSTSGCVTCVTTPTTFPARSVKVRSRESSMEPQRALLASAVGVVCRISRLICRLSIGIEQQDLAKNWSNVTQQASRKVLGKAWDCIFFAHQFGIER